MRQHRFNLNDVWVDGRLSLMIRLSLKAFCCIQISSRLKWPFLSVFRCIKFFRTFKLFQQYSSWVPRQFVTALFHQMIRDYKKSSASIIRLSTNFYLLTCFSVFFFSLRSEVSFSLSLANEFQFLYLFIKISFKKMYNYN